MSVFNIEQVTGAHNFAVLLYLQVPDQPCIVAT